MLRRPPRSTRTDTLFPYTTLFRSASASYGTDAVAGVVNFILDTDYVGLKTHAQGGITRYGDGRSEEHTSELQSLMRNSYAVLCLKKIKKRCIHAAVQKQRRDGMRFERLILLLSLIHISKHPT